jgi:glycosyltransferase involved in cell wall biosynthesis
MNISIIITTYNAERFIISTLNSIREQTYQFYEVIIMDDGSYDNTVAVVTEYIKLNNLEKFRLIPGPHIGRAKVLNVAVNQAANDWVAIVDADDLWNTHKLELQVKFINEYKLSALATRCCMFEHDDEVDIFRDFENFVINKENLQKASISRMIMYNMIPHSSILIIKQLLRYDDNRISQIDYELWLRLLYQGVDLYIVELELMSHRIHKYQSFEAKRPFGYALRATLLQLKYCIYCVKPLTACYVLIKLFYYMITNRKIKRWLGNKFNIRTSIINKVE